MVLQQPQVPYSSTLLFYTMCYSECFIILYSPNLKFGDVCVFSCHYWWKLWYPSPAFPSLCLFGHLRLGPSRILTSSHWKSVEVFAKEFSLWNEFAISFQICSVVWSKWQMISYECQNFQLNLQHMRGGVQWALVHFCVGTWSIFFLYENLKVLTKPQQVSVNTCSKTDPFSPS